MRVRTECVLFLNVSPRPKVRADRKRQIFFELVSVNLAWFCPKVPSNYQTLTVYP